MRLVFTGFQHPQFASFSLNPPFLYFTPFRVSSYFSAEDPIPANTLQEPASSTFQRFSTVLIEANNLLPCLQAGSLTDDVGR
jgi:hypothetical protein